jgi:hypothetical protein
MRFRPHPTTGRQPSLHLTGAGNGRFANAVQAASLAAVLASGGREKMGREFIKLKFSLQLTLDQEPAFRHFADAVRQRSCYTGLLAAIGQRAGH